jgi:uncharacterized protein (TIGR03790 family)
MLGVWLAIVAVPGPDSVAIVSNANDPDSVLLGERYREARHIPRNQVCALDLPMAADVDLADYLSKVEAPLEACLGDRIARIEAVVLMRGVPLRVLVPSPSGPISASLAAVLAAWKSTVASTGERLVGQAPGVVADCGGTPCVAAQWPNPFVRGTFEPGYARSAGGVDHRLLIVTMLHGRTFDDAAKLIESAVSSEGTGLTGEILLMRGADPARGVLDVQYPFVIADLDAIGVEASEVPFDPSLTGRTLAAFFVGTAALGETIEGNTFVPGAIVDNVTSFGAVPPNFGDPSEEMQVSIARWVAKGVAGVHGTTDEPLNNVFPSRYLVKDYVEGGTLGEAYFRRLPFIYWRNLVLGDPMAAPYAVRPEVRIELDGDVVAGSTMIAVTATHADGIDALALYVNGEAAPIESCLPLPEGQVELLAVAQAKGAHRPKGWASRTITVEPGPSDCSVIAPDAGEPDAAGADAGEDPIPRPPPEGCGCASSTEDAIGWLALAGLAFVVRRRS